MRNPGRKLSYGDIAAFAEVPAKAPEIKPEQLKKTADFRLIGKDVMRIELPSKVNGSATYGIDVQVPGMLYGTVLRAPVEGSVPDKIDDAKAKAVPGVIDVIRLPHGVGVVAETAWAAFEGAPGAHRCRHLEPDRHRLGLRQRQGCRSVCRRCEATFRGRRATGAHRAMPAPSSRRPPACIEAEYRCDYAYHAQMEPLNAVASVSPDGDAVEIWAGTQSQTTATEAPAKLLGISRDKVKLQ